MTAVGTGYFLHSPTRPFSLSFSAETQQEKKAMDRLQAPELTNIAGEGFRVGLL